MEMVVHDTADELAIAVSDAVSSLIEAGAPRHFTLGLAGGGTPEASYRRLRDTSLRWAEVDAWLCDERWVAPDDERSNGRMAAETLLDHVDATFHRPPWGEMIQPDDAAAHYEAAVRSIHPEGSPDLVLLGMGEDGHTASLFPGTKALAETRRWFVANHVPQQSEIRLTATYPLLWQARRVFFLVTGVNKARAVAESLRGQTPAGRVDEGEGEVTWHLDAAAASRLT